MILIKPYYISHWTISYGPYYMDHIKWAILKQYYMITKFFTGILVISPKSYFRITLYCFGFTRFSN